MKVIAIANQKGGVGKTTTTVSVAGLLAQEGHRVLLLDLDPHGSMTSYFGLDPDSVDNGVYTLFQQRGSVDPGRLVRKTRFDKLSLIPASMALATLDRQLGSQEGMGRVISGALKRLEADYDYVLMDCPPMLGVLMVNAIAACERLIIPVQTEFLALKGLDRMLKTLSMIGRSLNKEVEYLIVPTLFDRRTRASIETLRILHQQYREKLWDAVIPVDTRFREASRAGEPLPFMQPQARGSLAYKALVDYLHGFDVVSRVATR